jgi:ABC-type lipoprotein release transport system permease subunit
VFGRSGRGGLAVALSLWSRSDSRRRFGALIGLALLITLTGGATLAALAGARRSATAFDRLRARTLAMDAAVFGGPEQTSAAVADPRVAAWAPFSIAGVASVDDPDLFPFIAPGNDAIGRVIERPLILQGRRADPTRPDEIVLPEAVARRVHKRVGDEMKFVSVKRGEEDTLQNDRPKTDGPKFALRVVGISRASTGLVVRDRDIQFVYLTPAWTDRYAAQIADLGGGTIVRLRGGFADFGAWSRAVNPEADPESHPTPLFSPAPVEDSVSVIVDGLRLFALIAAVVGLVAIVQAVARHAAGSRPDLEVMRALGVSRPARAVALVLAVLPALVAGVIGAFLVAVAWSPLMPIGLARRAEPDRGWSFDGLILIGGTLIILLIVVAISATATWRVSRHRASRGARASEKRSVRQLSVLPRVVAAGVYLATRRDRGRDIVPVRSAMTGVAVAVAGVVAVSMFASGLHRVITTPARYGVPWDATAFHGNNADPTDRDTVELSHIPEVDAISIVHAQLDGLLNGQSDGNGFAIEGQRGRLGAVMRTGSAPAADDEIALGLDTAHRLGLHRGDTVRLTGSKGSRSMRVVGETLSPTVDDPSTLASGFLVTARAASALGLEVNDAFQRHVVTFKPGVSDAQGTQALERAGFEVSSPAPPSEVARLRDVESLPRALALMLALIGAVVVVLALVVTVRFRRRDLALLQVFGFRRAQLAGSVICQACIFAAVGIVVGTPLGLIIGRFAWQHLAGALGVATDPAVPVTGILLTACGVVAVAVVAALVPAARAARLRPAEILHQD